MPNWHIYLCIVQLQDNIKISDLITQGLISKQHQDILHIPMRRGGRVVEGARLESVYTSKAYRGFESLSLRHITIAAFLSLFKRFATSRGTLGEYE